MERMTDAETAALFEEYASTGDIEVRNRLLENFLYVAEIVAKKFVNRGVDYEDLYQVAAMAMVKAIARYDVTRGIKFTSFATPSLIGEIKNYFRDKTRMLHVSRKDSEQLMRLQEARLVLGSRGEHILPVDIANYMGITEERVLELMEIQQPSCVASLDCFANGEDDMMLSAYIGAEDVGFRKVDNKDFIDYSLHRLSERERIIVKERYWNNKSQKQVAEILGVSQMYVSRYERKILSKMLHFYNE